MSAQQHKVPYGSHVRVDDALHVRLKVAAAQSGSTVRALVARALTDWLDDLEAAGHLVTSQPVRPVPPRPARRPRRPA